jgi:hypothetical protein
MTQERIAEIAEVMLAEIGQHLQPEPGADSRFGPRARVRLVQAAHQGNGGVSTSRRSAM